jgi:RNA polymerase-binding transcription factor
METSEIGSFKGLLETMLKNTRLSLLERDEIAVENVPDVVDRSQRLAESDLAIQQIESHFNRTQDIKLALQRIADGSYGLCLRCDCDISQKRLQAVPWTPYCIHCQEIVDQERLHPEQDSLHHMLRLRDVA